MEQVQHQGGIKGRFGLFPEWVILAGILWCGVLDKVVDEPEYITVLTDIPKRVVAV